MIETFGGRKGVLKQNAISATVARPMHHITYSNCDLHYICAILLQGIATSHAFVDGNKRTAVLACVYAYATNGVILDGSKKLNKKLEDIVLDTVTDRLKIVEISMRLSEIVEAHTRDGIFGKAREIIDDFFSE